MEADGHNGEKRNSKKGRNYVNEIELAKMWVSRVMTERDGDWRQVWLEKLLSSSSCIFRFLNWLSVFAVSILFSMEREAKKERERKIKNSVCLRPHGKSKNFIIFNLFSICHWFDFLQPSSVTENNQIPIYSYLMSN